MQLVCVGLCGSIAAPIATCWWRENSRPLGLIVTMHPDVKTHVSVGLHMEPCRRNLI